MVYTNYMDAKEEVRARLAIEDVIGEYVQLKRAGRNFKGLSPFSSEKTPSFFVSPDKNIWHDFSSNKGGDIFSFVMEVEGLDFREALEMLARKAGVELAEYDNKTSRERAEKKKRLLEAHESAKNYYQQSLLKNKHALEYVFKKRGFNKKMVKDFGIGYAPDSSTALTNFLSSKKYTRRELSEGGLVNRFGGDLFRARLVIPLMDATGQVIGFTGRILKDEKNAPKYLNTPQTLLYDKGRHIFALSQAKEAIRESGYVVVVEGNLDVISSHQAGVRQTIATAGTAMTENHIRALKRLTSDVRLAYDGDAAGVAATERAIGLASVAEVDLKIISLPESAKDPDELIQQDKLLWLEAVQNAKPALDWILKQYSSRVDMTTATGKRAFTTAGLKLLANVSDVVEKEHYEKIIAKMTDSTLETVRQKLVKSTPPPKVLKEIKHVEQGNSDDYAYQDNALAVALIDAPSQELFTHFDPVMLNGDERRAVARYLAKNHGSVINSTPDDLQEFDTYVKILLLKAEARYAEWSENDRYFESARLIRQIENEYKKQKQRDLVDQLRVAEESGDEQTADALRVELNKLIKEIARGR